MNKQTKKLKLRQRRHRKIRAKILGTADIPRISVFKSNRHLYGQVIDDQNGTTLVTKSDLGISEKETKGFKIELRGKEKVAFIAGQLLASKMKSKKMDKAIFDRGGFKYHGRIKAFVEGLRNGGIKI